jgi:hypothetical protein
MPEAEQDELAQMLEQALTSQEIPEIIQTLLKLAEFMEHCDKVGCCRLKASVASDLFTFLA